MSKDLDQQEREMSARWAAFEEARRKRRNGASVGQYATRDDGSNDEPEADDLGTGEQDAALELPAEAFRGVFADYRDAMAGTSEASDSAHFAALWATAAALLHRRVSVFYAYPHFPNVYLLVFGPTGDSKTSAMRAALKILPEGDTVRVLRGLGSAEALGDWMQAGEGRNAHLLYAEEAGSLLSRGGWEGSTLLHFMTETFDAPDSYEIPYRKKPVKVIEPTPTLLAGTTSEWFWSAARERDFHGGFGNRLFFVTGSPKDPVPLPRKPDPLRLMEVKRALSELVTIERCEASLTPEAVAVWREFYAAWKKTGPLLDGLTAAATKRTHTYAMKLGLLYSALEHTLPTITEEQIVAAIKVAKFGFLCATRLIQGRQEFSVQGRCERAILAVLKAERLPAWRLHQSIGGGKFTAQDLDRALKALLATGAVVVVGQTGRGQPLYRTRGAAQGGD